MQTRKLKSPPINIELMLAFLGNQGLGEVISANSAAVPTHGSQTGRSTHRKASVCAAAVASGSNVRLESRVFSILICAS